MLVSIEQLVSSVEAPNSDSTPFDSDVWKNLDIPTATSIRNYLWQPKHNFNLTRSHLAAENDNAIILIEAYPPPKEATLRYLHEGGKKPQKYAHVS